MELNEVLSARRRELKMSYDELSIKSGVPITTLKKIFTGVTSAPRFENIRAISAAMNLSLEAIDALRSGQSPTIPSLIPMKDIERRRVPILGDIAAGTPITAEREYDEYVDVPDEGRHFDAALRVKGDSMTPMYLPDDLVLIRYQDDVDDGQVAAVCLDDEVTLKHLYHLNGGIQLISENRTYPPMLFTANDYANIHIVGLAVGFVRWEA